MKTATFMLSLHPKVSRYNNYFFIFTMYEPKNYDHLIGTPGFSDTLLKNHFTLYQGYVKNTNALIDAFADLEKADKLATPTFAELKRRFPWEFNGMRLHELYFYNMSKDLLTLDS